MLSDLCRVLGVPLAELRRRDGVDRRLHQVPRGVADLRRECETQSVENAASSSSGRATRSSYRIDVHRDGSISRSPARAASLHATYCRAEISSRRRSLEVAPARNEHEAPRPPRSPVEPGRDAVRDETRRRPPALDERVDVVGASPLDEDEIGIRERAQRGRRCEASSSASCRGSAFPSRSCASRPRRTRDQSP